VKVILFERTDLLEIDAKQIISSQSICAAMGQGGCHRIRLSLFAVV